jgi:hypothetical protein
MLEIPVSALHTPVPGGDDDVMLVPPSREEGGQSIAQSTAEAEPNIDHNGAIVNDAAAGTPAHAKSAVNTPVERFPRVVGSQGAAVEVQPQWSWGLDAAVALSILLLFTLLVLELAVYLGVLPSGYGLGLAMDSLWFAGVGTLLGAWGVAWALNGTRPQPAKSFRSLRRVPGRRHLL